MNRMAVIGIILGIIIVALSIYLIIMSSSTPSATPSPSVVPLGSPVPTIVGPSFQVKQYTFQGTQDVIIPLLSEDFVVVVSPAQNQNVSLTAWFNLTNNTNQDSSSLVVINSPVTITEPTPVLSSQALKANNVAYIGYPYLVLALNGSGTIYISFYVE